MTNNNIKQNLTDRPNVEERELLFYVVFDETCEIEGRFFKKGEQYPVFKKDEKYVILCAENRDFAFSNELMDRAIKEWDLEKILVVE